MKQEGDGDDPAAGATPPGGVVTGRVQVGRFVLQVGAPEGTRAVFAPAAATDSTALAVALSQPTAPAAALAEAEEALGEAESVTGKVERALELFTAVAQGRLLDKKFLLGEVDTLVGALERLDREGRHRDALRLARALAALLALATRWVALVESLRIALRAARALGDAPGVAWARHELGTLFLGAEDASAASRELNESLRLREELGDEAGAEVTRQNLAAMRQAFGGSGPSPALVAALVAGALLLAAGGVAVALALRDGGDDPAAPDTTPPAVSLTETPEDPTEERSASFSFEADEPAQRFECRLDDGPFQECVSPQNVPGELRLGEHVFAVRAEDVAGNVGEPAVYRWTIQAGEGPAAVILDGPAELTNETTATFVIDAGGAIRLECTLDGGDAQGCPNQVAFAVDEGEHTFVVRGFDGDDTGGPPATYRWTVDTTPPTVTVDSFEVTDTTAVLAFTPSEDVRELQCRLITRSPAAAAPAQEPECVSPVEYASLVAETTYLFGVVATDLAGNVGEAGQQEFTTEEDPLGGVDR